MSEENAVVETIAPNPGVTDSRLPEGVALKNDYMTDIDKFFDAPESGVASKVEAEAIPAKIKEVAKVEETKNNPSLSGLAAKLSSGKKPQEEVRTTAPVEAQPQIDAVAALEAEMKAHNPKWKPAKGWDTIRSTMKQEADKRVLLERELQETKAKIASPVIGGMTLDEVEALKAREKASSDRLMIMDVESHPSFRQEFTNPKAVEIAKANELLAASGIKGDVASLLLKPRSELGKAVADLVKDMPEFDRVEVAESIRKAYTIDQQSKAAIANSKELSKGLQQKSVDRQRQAFANRWAPVSAAIGEHIVAIDVPANATAEEKASAEAYNTELGKLRSKAEEIAFSPSTDENIAENAIKAAAYEFHSKNMMPRIISEYEQVVNLNRKLVSEIEAMRSRNPNRNLRGVPQSEEHATHDPNKMDHTQAADYYFRK